MSESVMSRVSVSSIVKRGTMAAFAIVAGGAAVLSSVAPRTMSAQSAAATHMEWQWLADSMAPPSGWLGIWFEPAPDTYPVILSVEPGSPAQKGGLAARDTLIELGEIDARKVPAWVARLVPNRKLTVKYRRNGVRSTVVTLVPRPPHHTVHVATQGTFSIQQSGDSVAIAINSGPPLAPLAVLAPLAQRGDIPIAGANLVRMTAGLATAMQVRPTGVLVVDVAEGSPAERAGLNSGDVVTAIGKSAVQDPTDIMQGLAAAAARNDRSIELTVLRAKKTHKLTLRW